MTYDRLAKGLDLNKATRQRELGMGQVTYNVGPPR
jgi:hypothetical protein